ncbi:MAG: zf-HC2 domain-containing protein [Bryobacterales bacterium]|nr:zf-HC2 domain-containing protein [Bryobacterales bacterium]
MERHATEEQILAWLDGELADAGVEAHIAGCEQCRVRGSDLGTASDAYGEYWKRRKQQAPPPPRTWKDASELMLRTPAHARGGAWMAIAASVLLGVFAVWRFSAPEKVSAAELLGKAESTVSTTAGGMRIEIRSKRDKMVRPAVWRRTGDGARLRRLFASANYDWESPLSVRSYRAWRESVTVRSDSVDVQPQLYVVRTETDGGVLREATLSLRKSDLRPVACHLEFRDDEQIDIVEAGVEPEAVSAEKPAGLAAEAKAQPATEVTASLELQVAEALHRIGADLGDPIEVERSGGTIVITATGLDARKSEQLIASLRIPGVEVRLVAPRQSEVATQTESANGTARRPAREWEQRLTGHYTYEEFADRVLGATEGMTARAYALKALAEQFPAAKEEQLSMQERAVLRAIAGNHVAAMRGHVQRLDQLAAILDPAGESVTPGLVGGDWRARAQRLYELSARTDLAASALFSPDAVANLAAIRAAVLQVAAALEEWR